MSAVYWVLINGSLTPSSLQRYHGWNSLMPNRSALSSLPLPPIISRLLEVCHVARRLSRSVGYVRRLIRDGKLVAVWEGDEWRVDPREFEAYLDRCRQAARERTRRAVRSFPRASA